MSGWLPFELHSIRSRFSSCVLQKLASIFAIVKSIFESCSKAVLFFLKGQVSLLSSMCEQKEKV